MAISVFGADCGKILPPAIRMIYTSSWLHFQGGSDHPIRILKFRQWQLLWPYQCLRQIENITSSNQDDLYIILIAFSRGFRPSDQNFEIPSMASAMVISVFEADCGKILSPPIRMIYTSSWSNFPGGSDHPIRILKFHQWHLLWPYQCLRQIAGKYYPLQSGWFIHHPDHIFQGVPTIRSEFWNSISGICYGHISIWGRLRENIIPSNQDDLYIILTTFSRGFWPSDQKFKIPSVASAMAISVFEADCGKILYPPIRIIYTSSWQHFQGGSNHPIRILKFHQGHLLWPYQCFTQILENFSIHPSRWSIYHLQLVLWDILNLKSGVSNYNCSINWD